MSANEDHFKKLLDKYALRQASPEEVEELFALIKDSGHDEDLQRLLVAVLENTNPVNGEEQLWNSQFDQLLATAKSREAAEENQVRPFAWRRLAIAVCVLLLISVSGYLLLKRGSLGKQEMAQVEKQDFLPGGNKAILTLSNGKQIVLTNAKNGRLANQAGMSVNKTGDGKVVYQPADNASDVPEKIEYNTYSTPKGGQFQVVLPDGSHVWLNDASSIRFPVNFAGNERLVSITGEVYFEVAHNKAKPFKVTVNGQTVEVLGTHFNINSYSDEPALKTTLLEGSVRVAKGANIAVLKPGEQSLTTEGNTNISIEKDVDTDEEIAWKNGFFQIKGADLQTIMRQAARWYDVDIEYQGEIPQRSFTGKINRSVNASKFLEALGFFDVHFQIQGKKIIVKS
ncbi:FecR family protein [Mucilaginibacter paludis]|uniref:Anti-FecI sigma factor, FecR n=1 Tax=Mucilaginibacter paludis DSM 18603 TaxID=714943 RepID=H1XZ25_9SPHI|nr:FecR family protein [Mucilaginibacter paludis]EHQ24610.1 anti-FecI sigma factor, FecR [Mucilaginibacter paludis DSM 18603]